MIRGEGTAVVKGVTPDEVFDFVLDPAQYTKADTKIVWVTKLADLPGGMLAREDGKFLGLFKGSVVTRYRWTRPTQHRRHARARRAPGPARVVRDRAPSTAGPGCATSRSSTSGTGPWGCSTTPWPARGSPARSPGRSPRSRACSSRGSGVGGPSTPRRPERPRPAAGPSTVGSGPGEADVERPQVGVEAGVLHRQQVGGRPRLVVVAVPEPGRGHEGAAGLPVHPLGVDDGAVGPDLGADQGVAPRVAVAR